MPDPIPRLVLLHHAGRQARGAWFEVAHRAVLAEAAAQPQHALIELDTAKLKELAPDLLAGKLGPAGKPDQLPLVLPGPFARLLELAKVGALVTAPAPGAPPRPISSDMPPPWSSLVTGSVVLASDAKDDGWWECVVVALEGNNMLRLKWRDFPDFEPFSRVVTRVGLLPPSGQR